MAEKKKRGPKRAFGKVVKKGQRFYAEYTGPDGKIHTPGRSFATKTDAEGWLATERRLIDLETWAPPKQRREEAAKLAAVQQQHSMTVGELIEDWLTRADIKETTRRSHRKTLRLRATCDSIPNKFDSLKDVRVVDVDKARVRLWIDQMLALWPEGSKGYSTCFYARKRLATAFVWARDELGLIQDNPVAEVSMHKPQARSKDEPVFTAEEAATIVKAFPKHLEHAPLILLYCGLRLGELLELRVKDISGVQPGAPMVLKIRRDMSDTEAPDGRLEVLINSTPKTDAGCRDVNAPEWVAESIRAHLLASGKTEPEDLVVSRKNGNQFTQRGFRDYYFDPAKKAAGRGHNSRVHSCRSFYGTQLVRLVMAGRLSMEEARRLMGHTTTMQLMEYQRAEVGYQQRAAEALNELRPEGL